MAVSGLCRVPCQLDGTHCNVTVGKNLVALAEILRKWIMTMANERTRAVIHTREFLEELSRDTAQTESIRKTAVALLRHYPSDSDILLVGKIQERYAAMSIITPIFSSTIE